MGSSRSIKESVIWRASGLVARLMSPILQHALDRDSKSIERERQRLALRSTARFVDRQLSHVASFPDRMSLLAHAASMLAHPEGLVCEFGVAGGASINHLAELLPDKTIYGFDSFQGLPEDWRDGFPKGTFRVGSLPKVRSNVVLIQGLFDETLPTFLRGTPGRAGLLHVDCDLYSSTRTVLEQLRPRIEPGTVIVFDEYFNYPGWQLDEHKAFREFLESTGLSVEYLGYCRDHHQLAARIKHPTALATGA